MTTVPDPYSLQRFLDAQRAVYAQVETELRAGRKESHWMWYIFPQIKGLGHSAMAQKYAISSVCNRRWPAAAGAASRRDPRIAMNETSRELR
jgi:uncharacterized protein (DUF1810 family)